jgi:DNA-3-methyladenine glycosylase II
VIIANVMLDHPAWVTADGTTAVRAVRLGLAVWTVVSTRAGDGWHVTTALVDGTSEPLTLDVADPGGLSGPAALTRPLRDAGKVVRLRNPDLWDALATSIVRQVIRASQARKLYRALCREHGQQVESPAGPVWLFPTAETVLALSDEEFARLGLAFKTRPLRAAAKAYLQSGATWGELSPATLVTEVQTVPRIGPWTAGATVADASNDFSLYPFADLAVRTWAKRLAPERVWPDTEPEFAQVWQELAGEQLPEWTLLTLAWGVRNAHAGAI